MRIHFPHFARNSSPATFATRLKSIPDPSFNVDAETPTDPLTLPHSSLFTLVLPLFAMKRIFSLLLLLFAVTLRAQEADSDGKITLTVILRHDQSMTVDEINDHLEERPDSRKRKISHPRESRFFPTTSSWASDTSSRYGFRRRNSAKSTWHLNTAFGEPSEQSSIRPTTT